MTLRRALLVDFWLMGFFGSRTTQIPREQLLFCQDEIEEG